MIPLSDVPHEPGAYIVHIEPPLGHARNYTGSAANLHSRLKADLDGTGARLLRAALDRGRALSVSRIWVTGTGTEARQVEAGLKERRDTPRICPQCTPGTTRAAEPRLRAQRRPNRNPPVRR